MKYMKPVRNIFLVCLFVLLGLKDGISQKKPDYWDDIQAIKQYDKIYTPPKDPILFTGSSSFRLWHSMAEMFRGYKVLNRGIGGAVLSDIDRYVEDIIVPYHPKQIVLYIGENDIVSAPNGDSIFVGFQKLYQHIRTVLPEVPVVYVSIKPSPSRERFLPIAARANTLINDFLKSAPQTVYVDIYSPMLDKNGHTRPELFGTDMLHMNAYGYRLWYKRIKPVLVKN